MGVIICIKKCLLYIAQNAEYHNIEFQTAPSKGFCASQNSWFYGYKLHGVCSLAGVFHFLGITKAEVHDINFLKNIKQQMSDCVLLGDRGYLSVSIQLDLFQTVNIKLDPSQRE